MKRKEKGGIAPCLCRGNVGLFIPRTRDGIPDAVSAIATVVGLVIGTGSGGI